MGLSARVSSGAEALVRRVALSQAGIIGAVIVTLLNLDSNADERCARFISSFTTDGMNPAVYDPSDPIKLWIIQVGAYFCSQ